uniref:Caffeoylshikimate esterase n=2 Tax=Elaeis guineensis var. tenera TaxID=51953 RepID=A0A6I9R766_ELAGV|nr:caffeoylshikimate esterase [Elaeis guineensis]
MSLGWLSFLMEVEYQEEFIRNSRGVQLFTCRWLPSSSSPKALVFLCHGYGMECSEFMKAVGTGLAGAGYAVYGMDYEGHGKSDGRRCYIRKFGNVVADCDRFFKSICVKEDYINKSRFLYGESMGGAVALLLHKRDPTFWDGAVLVAPMCKISEEMKPSPLVVNILTQVEDIIPTWKIVPTKQIVDTAFRDPVKREEIRHNKLIYQDKPRLKTALELLRTSMELEDSLSKVSLPFLVLHGEADTVTDPEVSRALYERASSVDKTITLYAGMWHGLTSGEPDDNVEKVFSDVITWLDHRAHERPGRSPSIRNITCVDASPSPKVKRWPSGATAERRPSGGFCFGWKGRTEPHSAL